MKLKLNSVFIKVCLGIYSEAGSNFPQQTVDHLRRYYIIKASNKSEVVFMVFRILIIFCFISNYKYTYSVVEYISFSP